MEVAELELFFDEQALLLNVSPRSVAYRI